MNRKSPHDQIVLALASMFANRHCLFEPSFPSCRPDLLTVSFHMPEFEIAGYEVKGGRPEWLRELRTGKNARAREICDLWFIVAPEEVVKLEELPPEWGLYVVHSGMTFECVKGARRLTPEKVIGRDLAALILRAVKDNILKTELEEKAYRKGFDDALKVLLEWKPYGRVSGPALNEVIHALYERKDFKLRRDLEKIRDDAASVYHSAQKTLTGLGDYRDWKTGKPFPPQAEAYRKEAEKYLLNHPSLADLKKSCPEDFERILDGHVGHFLNGNPIIQANL